MGKVIPNPCCCLICGKETSHLGIKTHLQRSHGSLEEMSKWHATIIAKASLKVNNELIYLENPNYCTFCQSILPYNKRNNKYCNHSCKATHGNIIHPRKATTKTHNIQCEKCGKTETRSLSCKRFHCNNCKTAREKYKFSFNIADYPDLFDIEFIKTVGFCTKGPGKRDTSKLSRDHKVSISDAAKGDYDPYYITHPLNCELMTMKQNNEKKSKSSISYDDLILLVDSYERINGGPDKNRTY